MRNFSRRNIDIVIGLFVAFAVAGTVFIALRSANITDISKNDGYSIYLQFDNVGSLVERSPVKSSGVRVGQIRTIRYNNDDHIADVEIVINNAYQFPTDSIFSIVSSNLLGGQYIAIEVGGEEEMLKDGDEMVGNSAIILEELIGQFLFDKAGE